MSWDHGTFGWEKYEAFCEALNTVGIKTFESLGTESYSRGSDSYSDEPRQRLRTATYTQPDGREMVVEEYLSVDDGDCDGRSSVDIVRYPKGQRPNIYRVVYDGGHCGYTGTPAGWNDDAWREFRYCLTDGTYELPKRVAPEPPELEWVSAG